MANNRITKISVGVTVGDLSVLIYAYKCFCKLSVVFQELKCITCGYLIIYDGHN